MTTKGKDLEGPVTDAAQAALTIGFEGLTAQETSDVQRLLKKIFDNLEQSEKGLPEIADED